MRIRKFHRGLRVARMLAKALFSTRHPVLATLVVTRRCNLTCTYCNEYDQGSDPVPLDALISRVDKLASMGTSIITLSGGEPLLHPELEQVVAYIRRRGIMATVITNGYLLTNERINKLNEAGLDYLQISIDNVKPDAVSMKSLKTLDAKLVMLSRDAKFGVNVNAVLGAGVKDPEDAVVVARRSRELGFGTSLGIVHDGSGRTKPLNEREGSVYAEVKKDGGIGFAVVDRFEGKLAQGRPNRWRCRAGSRYLYIDEFGLVHWCSQQRGRPAIALESYSAEDMRREYLTEKPCAPYCSIQCVHRASMLDAWRNPQTPALTTRSRMREEQRRVV